MDLSTEKIESAGKKKEEGNALFKLGRYARASKRYEKAAKLIEYDTSFGDEEKKQSKVFKVSCNLNNAACKLKLKDYKQAEKLCTKVLEVDSRNVKALYRRAQAYMGLADLDLAELDIKKALEIDPDNRSGKFKEVHNAGDMVLMVVLTDHPKDVLEMLTRWTQGKLAECTVLLNSLPKSHLNNIYNVGV